MEPQNKLNVAVQAARDAYVLLASCGVDMAATQLEVQSALIELLGTDPALPVREPDKFQSIKTTIDYLRISAEFIGAYEKVARKQAQEAANAENRSEDPPQVLDLGAEALADPQAGTGHVPEAPQENVSRIRRRKRG